MRKRDTVLRGGIFIPANDYGIVEGYYTAQQLVVLLRKWRRFPTRIRFLADMMED